MSGERWLLRRKASEAFVAQQGELDPVLARILYARGIDTPERIEHFLGDSHDQGNPFDLPDMAAAVARIREALKVGEQIVVYGDYDVDGVSATALLVSGLSALGGNVRPYIPDRFSEAYGLNTPALDVLRAGGASLVVTVDCGIRSVREVAHAGEIGLDMVLTDHHSAPDVLPSAIAVIDPKRPDSKYPFSELSGVGVAYRLLDALCRVASQMERQRSEPLDPTAYLDLVALGTIADIVPLLDENRGLARQGLERLRRSPRVGLKALMEVAECRPEDVDSRCIGFRLGPRLNAAGRMRHGELAYSLLMTESEEEARRLAAELSEINRDRQRLLDQQVTAARGCIGEVGDRRVLVVAGPEFHEGIVGLIASRLVEEFHRPAFVMRRDTDDSRGSARSIDGFHVTHALGACADLLSRFGGHARAAGFSLPSDSLSAFEHRLEEYAAEHLPDELLDRRVDVDAIVSLECLTMDTVSALRMLEPCGEGNPDPALASLGLQLLSVRRVGDEGKHLRLEVGDGVRSLSAIGFDRGYLGAEYHPGDWVDLVFVPTLNEWQGEVSLQLLVKAIRPSTTVAR